MFLHKKPAVKSAKRLKLDVKLDFDAKEEELRGGLNVFRDGNRLVSKFQRNSLPITSPLKQTLGTNGDVVYLLFEDGLYAVQNALLSWLTLDVAEKACFCVYRGDTVVSSKEFGTYFLVKTKAKKVYADGFSSMTVCADRIFGLYGKDVRYTAAGERDGWDNGETITLPSACDALVTIGQTVYALGNTCYKIAPDGDDVEFKFRVFANNIGAVAPLSVVNYNGRAVLASTSGLYQINSDKLTPIFEELSQVVDFSAASGAMSNGKYYLTCRTKNSSEIANDVTLILDLDSEKIVGNLGEGFGSICANNEMIYSEIGGKLYRIKSGVSQGKYLKTNVDFSTSQKKFLDSMTVTTLNDLDVIIRSENETRLYKIAGKKTPQKINLRDMGWEFSIELSSDMGLNVEKMTLFAHTTAEV